MCVLVGLSACAGELEDPDRFGFVLNNRAGGGGGPAAVGGTGGSGAGPSTGGTSAAGRGTASGGAGGAGGGGSMMVAAAPACVAKLFKDRCNSAACHGSGSTQIDLVSTGFETRLVDKPASAACMSKKYVNRDGSGGLLLDKLAPSPPCGSQMPLGQMLSDDEDMCVRDWVNSVGK